MRLTKTCTKIALREIFRRRDVQLFFLLIIVYTANLRPIVGDAEINNYVAISIIREGDFDLDEFARYINARTGPVQLKGVIEIRGHNVSTDDIGGSILAVPVFFVPVISGVNEESWIIPYLGKMAATILVALSAIFLYYALRRLTKEKYAFCITSIYAFATSSWSISSQGLWSHGPSQFSLALALYFLVRGLKERKYVAYSGLPLGFAVVCRSVNLLVLVIFGIYVLHKYRDKFLKFISLAVIPLIFLLWYNYYYFGSPFTSGKSFLYGKQRLWKNNFLEGFFGQLISPSGGLFVYSPVLVFSIYGIYYSWKNWKIFFCYSTIVIFTVIAFYSRFKIWYGGSSWGPRYTTDILPFFSILLIPAIKKVNEEKVLKVVFILLLAFSIFVQLEGILFFDGKWHEEYNTGPADHSFLWSLENTQIAYYLKNPNFKIPINISLRIKR